MREIEASLLIHKYDPTGREGLVYEELKSFLKVFIVNGGLQSKLRTEDLDFVMALLGKNSEVYDLGSRFKKEQVLKAVRSWYSWQFMPLQDVSAILSKHMSDDEDMSIPKADVLSKVLSDLNGFEPVSYEDVEFVTSLLYAFGATETKLSLSQMCKAVAVWYINVERARTGLATIVFYTCWALVSYLGYHLKRCWKKTPGLSRAPCPSLQPGGQYDALLRGDSIDTNSSGHMYRPGKKAEVMPALGSGAPVHREQSSMPTLSTASTMGQSDEEDDVDDEPLLILHSELPGGSDAVVCMVDYCMPITFWVLLCVWPGFYIVHIADSYQTKPTCQDNLSMMMRIKGWLVIFTGLCGIIYNFTAMRRDIQQICALGGVIASALCFIQELFGFFMVLGTSPTKCGGYIWEESGFFFVWSVLWLPFACCCAGLCSVSCVAGAATRSRLTIDGHMSKRPFAPDREWSPEMDVVLQE